MNTNSENLSESTAPQPAPGIVQDPVGSADLQAVVPIDQPLQKPNPASRPESVAIRMSSVLGAAEALSDDEGIDYLACETVIETGWRGGLDIGLAFARIRDGRLYRVEFETFDDYCRQKWQYRRDYVDRIISAAL